MSSKTRKDKMKNKQIQEHLRVAPIDDKIRETHLRRFGQQQRR